MVWIEHLLKKGETEWPWFSAVLEFIQSPEYEKTKKSLLAEIKQEQERWGRITLEAKSHNRNTSLRQNISANQKCQQLQSSDVEEVPDPPYFWKNLDTSWWREQP